MLRQLHRSQRQKNYRRNHSYAMHPLSRLAVRITLHHILLCSESYHVILYCSLFLGTSLLIIVSNFIAGFQACSGNIIDRQPQHHHSPMNDVPPAATISTDGLPA